MQYFDLIVFAVIAVALLLRLRSVLGERDEDDVPDFEPHKNKKDDTALPHHSPLNRSGSLNDGAMPANMIGPMEHAVKDAVSHSQERSVERWAQNLPDYTIVDTATVHNHMIPFLAVDPGFRPDEFLDKAQKAFGMVLRAYSEGALNTLEFLLAPALYRTFADRIAARQENRETYVVQLHGIQKAVISDAALDGTQARLTVDFISEQAVTHKDAEGRIVDDNDGRRRVSKDRWTFKKDLRDPSPVWLVAQTGPITD